MEKLTDQLQAAKISLQELTSQRDEVASLHQREVSACGKLREELNSTTNKLSDAEKQLTDLQTKLNGQSQDIEKLQAIKTKLQEKLKAFHAQARVSYSRT